MDATVLDTITKAFVDAMKTGTGALAQYSLPLLGAFALIAFYTQVGPVVASGAASAGDVVASVLLTAVKIGIFYWLLVQLSPLAEAAFLTFLQWGIAPTGGGISAESFTAPSRIIDLGFRAAAPLQRFTMSFVGTLMPWNWITLLGYALSYWVIVIAFAFVALHLMMTIIRVVP